MKNLYLIRGSHFTDRTPDCFLAITDDQLKLRLLALELIFSSAVRTNLPAHMCDKFKDLVRQSEFNYEVYFN